MTKPATFYKEIKKEVNRMSDDKLKDHYLKLSSGIENKINEIIERRGIIEGYIKDNHSLLVLALMRGKKSDKFNYFKKLVEEQGSFGLVKYKQTKKPIQEVFFEACREKAICDEILNRKLY